MTVLDHTPRSGYALRLQRRHQIVATGGMEGVLSIGTALRAWGLPIRDFTVEVHDGVPYSTVICTASLTSAESQTFTERLGTLACVVSVEPC